MVHAEEVEKSNQQEEDVIADSSKVLGQVSLPYVE